VQKKQLLLNLIVTASLAFPGIAAGAFQQEMSAAEKIKALHPVKLPAQLGDALAKASPADVDQPDLVCKRYISPANARLWAMVRQTSIFTQIHDFTDCLISNGYKPESVKRVAVKTDAGTMDAQILATHGKANSLAILWFQTGTISGADRWQWRQRLLTGGMPKLPVCRETQISLKRSGDDQQDMRKLTEAAVSVYRSQIE